MISFRIAYRNIKYVITLRHKVSLIVGLSSTGKTTLIEAIGYNREGNTSLLDGKTITTISEDSDLIAIRGIIEASPEGSVIVVDELPPRFLAEVSHQINNKKCWFLIINRAPIPNVHISADAVYSLEKSGDTNTLSPAYVQQEVFIREDLSCEGQ